MSSLVQMFRSSLGRKYLMALTGLGLAVFTITHMAGNLLLFMPDGGVSYNAYSYQLTHNKAFLFTAEAGLLALFLIHIGNALALNMRNFGARQAGYTQGTHGDKGVTVASKTMPYTGALVLAFVLVHLWHFKFGTHFTAAATIGGNEVRDMYRNVAEAFADPTSPWLWFYLGSLVVLLVHLVHGVQSTAQSLGLTGRPTRSPLQLVGVLVAYAVAFGFMLPPLYLAFVK